jgi:hypothetical protein
MIVSGAGRPAVAHPAADAAARVVRNWRRVVAMGKLKVGCFLYLGSLRPFSATIIPVSHRF